MLLCCRNIENIGLKYNETKFIFLRELGAHFLMEIFTHIEKDNCLELSRIETHQETDFGPKTKHSITRIVNLNRKCGKKVMLNAKISSINIHCNCACILKALGFFLFGY